MSLDIGRLHAGAVFGFMNMTANAASALSSVVFGYIVALTGSYNAPLIPMAAVLGVGAWLWLQMDPTQQLFEEESEHAGESMPGERVAFTIPCERT